MLKRTIPLLIAVAIALSAAPAALAHDCWQCRIVNLEPTCVIKDFGRTDCDDFNGCVLGPTGCSHALAAVTLSSEFEVASVERIDGEAPAANETRIAKLDAPKPAPDSTR